jgi:hypothetical protein
MDDQRSLTVLGRRSFLKSALPGGALFCLGCGPLLALGQSQEKVAEEAGKHKFMEDSGMSFKEVYDFAFSWNLIPILQSLSHEIGKEKLIEMLKKKGSEEDLRSSQEWAKKLGRNDLAAYAQNFRKSDSFWQHVLTYEIVEDTPKAFEVKISECLWAATFREAKASEIGYAVCCYGDYASTQGFNPKLEMFRTKTLMQGDAFCNNRYVMKA